MVQICLFLGNTAQRERAFIRRWIAAWLACRSVSGETRVAEQFQPVGMTLPAQQFGRAFVDAFGMLAALEAAMVEEELQQGQVVRTQLSAQEEVAAQSAVDVLDDRTGADDMVRYVTHGFAQVVEMVAEFLPQRRFLLPTQRLTAVACLEVEQLPDDVDGDV